MMKLLSVAALSYVAAADVPVFSSNDDYDEINLNIRLLASNDGTQNVTANYKVNGDMASTWTSSGGSGITSYTDLCNTINTHTETVLKSETSSATSEVTSCGQAATRRLSTERKLSAVDVTQAYSLGFATAAAADAAVTLISSDAFATSFASALNAALAAAGSTLSATVTFSAPTQVELDASQATVPPATTAAPAVAAPSPSPSSDASMIKATTAIFAAVVASLF